MDVCTIPDILKILKFLLILIDIIKFLVPMGLIVMGSIDLSKSVIAKDESEMKKNWNLFFKRIIYSVVLFLLPTIVNFVIVFLGDLTSDINLSVCIANTENIAYYEELAKERYKKEEEARQKELEAKRKKAQENAAIKNAQRSSSSNEGTVLGQKYNLSDSQLRGIAMICQREQGSAVGAAAEASLIANRFELHANKQKFGTGATGLYNYVKNSGWWGNSAGTYMADTKKLKSDVLTAVHNVLVLGKRTLPLYVDEHDCIDCGAYGFDVVKIVIGDKIITNQNELLNRDNYKKDVTVIYNKYESVFTFHSFPTDYSDPFGYTDGAKIKYNELNNK